MKRVVKAINDFIELVSFDISFLKQLLSALAYIAIIMSAFMVGRFFRGLL